MLPRALLAILCVAATSTTNALPNTPRDTSTQLAADIYAIDAAVLPLTANVNAYQSGPFPTSILNGGPILLDVVNIHLVNRKAYTDALLSPVLTDAQTTDVVNAVTNSVAIDIPISVRALIAKKGAFQSAGLGVTVLASLNLLKYDHDSLSAVVSAKLTGTAQERAKGAEGIKVIDDALSEGIAAYS